MSSIIKHAINLILFSFGKIKPITGPIRVHWDITELCNSRCRHCTRWKLKSSKTDLSTNKVKKIIKELKYIGVKSISFAGNEPLIRKDISDLIKYTTKYGIFSSINTNGLLLNKEKTEKLIKNGVGTFIFSIDSDNEKDHDFLRGVPGSFNKTFKLVNIIRSIRKKLKKRVDIQVTTVVSKKNVNKLYEIVKLCNEKGVDKMIIQPIHFIKKYFETEKSLILTEKDIPIMQEQLTKIEKDFKDFVVVPKNYLENFKTFFNAPNKLYKYRCTAFFITADIRSNGNVIPCPVGFRKIGNLKEKSFKEIWFSKEANKLREDIKNNKHPLCWFSCIQPINLIAYDIKNFNILNLINFKFIKHALSKI
ncbi:hypothetical protein CMI40_01185 [Candidatus Pacearchaeota archaeon]|jgi:MoaA/NifB/PqqE/SkfB family radical SAM enzyme|nr:hypothetical protein [Candidatus Pacearchaeota archaeon]|tara:strand:- start:8297 stop:9385 length:1089 start_codon:yes stop_codon:yes gene_type:complete